MFDVSDLADGETARCSRCGHFLTRYRADELSRVMAFTVSALILLALACSFPFMEFKASGLESLMTLPQAALELWRNDMPDLAFLVAAFIILIPAAVLILIVILVGALMTQRPYAFLPTLGRLIFTLQNWSMVEVFFIGVLVSLVKIAEYGDRRPRYLVLGLCRFQHSVYPGRVQPGSIPVLAPYRGIEPIMKRPATAAEKGLASCHLCLKLASKDLHHCPRCGSALHLRKTASLQRTLALLITAMVLYLPANILPIMVTDQLGRLDRKHDPGWRGAADPAGLDTYRRCHLHRQRHGAAGQDAGHVLSVLERQSRSTGQPAPAHGAVPDHRVHWQMVDAGRIRGGDPGRPGTPWRLAGYSPRRCRLGLCRGRDGNHGRGGEF